MEPLNTNMPGAVASQIFQAFGDAFKQARMEKILREVHGGNQEAMADLYAQDPQMAMRIQEQMRQQEERRRVETARRASGEYLKASNPNDQALIAAIEAGADPNQIALLRTRETRQNQVNLKTMRTAHENVMALLPTVTDQASYDWAKQRAKAIYESVGLDSSEIDSYPAIYDPQVVENLRLTGMDVAKQLAAADRGRNIDNQITNRDARTAETNRHNQVTEGQGDRRLTETNRHNTVTEGQGDRRITETGRHNLSTEINTRRGQTMTDQRVRQSPSYNKRQRGGYGGQAPKPGDVVNGYRFKGGDRSDPANWVKQ